MPRRRLRDPAPTAPPVDGPPALCMPTAAPRGRAGRSTTAEQFPLRRPRRRRAARQVRRRQRRGGRPGRGGQRRGRRVGASGPPGGEPAVLGRRLHGAAVREVERHLRDPGADLALDERVAVALADRLALAHDAHAVGRRPASPVRRPASRTPTRTRAPSKQAALARRVGGRVHEERERPAGVGEHLRHRAERRQQRLARLGRGGTVGRRPGHRPELGDAGGAGVRDLVRLGARRVRASSPRTRARGG